MPLLSQYAPPANIQDFANNQTLQTALNAAIPWSAFPGRLRCDNTSHCVGSTLPLQYVVV